jgi:hypothetical protein
VGIGASLGPRVRVSFLTLEIKLGSRPYDFLGYRIMHEEAEEDLRAGKRS